MKLKGKINDDQMQRLTGLIVIIVMMIFFSIGSIALYSNQVFFTLDNMMNIALQTSVTAISAYGMTFVIISQAVDLSMGSNIAVVSVIVAMMICADIPLVICILVGCAIGGLVGIINGFTVSKMNLPPFIATLGMQMALRGFALVITNATSIYLSSESGQEELFGQISKFKIAGVVPLPVVYIVVLGIFSSFVLKKTVLGRYVFAVGSNEDAAKLSGINTSRIRMFAYFYCGVMTAIAAIVLTARVNSGQPTIGSGYEANAIAAAVIGGASMTGGHGSISGTIIGAFIMGILMNGLNIIGVSTNWQTLATGLIVIGAVYLDKLRREKSMS